MVLGRMERIVRRAPAAAHPIINRLVAEASPQALGGKSLADVLCTGLKISKERGHPAASPRPVIWGRAPR